MPLDWLSEDEKVLGKDLKPGDCLRETRMLNSMGIIIATTFVLDKRGKELKSFYEETPAFEIYDINCSEDGSYSSHLDPEQEFKVIRSRKDILYTYEKVEYSLLKRSADLMTYRSELKQVQVGAMDRMNDRCDKLKEEAKK